MSGYSRQTDLDPSYDRGFYPVSMLQGGRQHNGTEPEETSSYQRASRPSLGRQPSSNSYSEDRTASEDNYSPTRRPSTENHPGRRLSTENYPGRRRKSSSSNYSAARKPSINSYVEERQPSISGYSNGYSAGRKASTDRYLTERQASVGSYSLGRKPSVDNNLTDRKKSVSNYSVGRKMSQENYLMDRKQSSSNYSVGRKSSAANYSVGRHPSVDEQEAMRPPGYLPSPPYEQEEDSYMEEVPAQQPHYSTRGDPRLPQQYQEYPAPYANNYSGEDYRVKGRSYDRQQAQKRGREEQGSGKRERSPGKKNKKDQKKRNKGKKKGRDLENQDSSDEEEDPRAARKQRRAVRIQKENQKDRPPYSWVIGFAVLVTFFWFPPLGIIALCIGCKSYRKWKSGDKSASRRLGRIAKHLLFASLFLGFVTWLFVFLFVKFVLNSLIITTGT